MDSRALDSYLTRGPYDYEEPQVPHCSNCGGFLKLTPDRTETWESAVECDGKLKWSEAEYEEGTVAILGNEYRGKTYRIYWFDCGSFDSGKYDVNSDTPEHELHSVVAAAGTKDFRTCSRCGHENVEIDG